MTWLRLMTSAERMPQRIRPEKPGGQIAPNLLPGAYRHVNWCGAEGDSFADSFADINSRAQNMV